MKAVNNGVIFVRVTNKLVIHHEHKTRFINKQRATNGISESAKLGARYGFQCESMTSSKCEWLRCCFFRRVRGSNNTFQFITLVLHLLTYEYYCMKEMNVRREFVNKERKMRVLAQQKVNEKKRLVRVR